MKKILLIILFAIPLFAQPYEGMRTMGLDPRILGTYKNTANQLLPTDKMYFRWSGDSATVIEIKSQAPHLLINNSEHIFWLDTLRVEQTDESLQPEIIPDYFNGHSAIRFYWESNLYHYYNIIWGSVGMAGILTGGVNFPSDSGIGYILTVVIQAKGNNDTADMVLGDVVDWGLGIPWGWMGSRGLVGQDDGGRRMVGATIDTLKHIINYTPTQMWLDGRKVTPTFTQGGYMRGWHLTFLGYSGFVVNLGCRNTYLADIVCYYDTVGAKAKVAEINAALNQLYHWKCTSAHTQISNMDIENWDTTYLRVRTNYMTVPTFTVNWYRNTPANGINSFTLTQIDSNQTALWKGAFNRDHTYLSKGDSVFITIITTDKYYTAGDTLANYRININLLSNLVPKLTSDSSASPILITASSQFSADAYHQKWRAFDRDTTLNWWATAGTSIGWIQVDFGLGITKTAKEYVIFGPTSGSEANAFKTWRLLGSLTASTWDTLDIQINAPVWTAVERRDYSLTNVTAYRYYRWSVTANQGGLYLGATEIRIKGLYSPVGVVSNNEVPLNFELLQNYPNPFNPSTNIKFAIPKESIVTLKVYNMIGAEVRTLVDGSYRAGTYNIFFEGSNLASGVYLYKLTAGDFTQTKKMLLVK